MIKMIQFRNHNINNIIMKLKSDGDFHFQIDVIQYDVNMILFQQR